MTLAEEDPAYASIVAEYLKRSDAFRLPWGGIVIAGHITMTRSFTERRIRTELGETALELLTALGISVAVVDEIRTTCAWNAKPEELIVKLQEIRAREPAP